MSGPGFAAATPQCDATAAAEEAFAAGGNAVDAALAAAVALSVTYPHNCSPGGDLFALVRDPQGRIASVDASGPAAGAATLAAQRACGATMPLGGPDPITVPGVVGGWGAVHALGAALPWRRAFEPAIALAQDGVQVAPSLAGAIAAERAAIAADPGLSAVFRPSGVPLRAGERLRQPALAATLATIAQEGPRALYDGPLAALLVEGLAERGCRLTAADLRAYEPAAPAPLRVRFRGLDVVTSPPGSSGVVLLQALAALDAAEEPDPLGAGAGLLAEIFRLGGEARDRWLCDPRAHPFDEAGWLGEEAVGTLVACARAAAAGERPAAPGAGAARPGGDTVAVTTADGEGWAVSLIQSVFHPFGAHVLEPVTGVLLHNRGAMFSLEAAHPNALAPGKRPAHTLLPALVEQDGALRCVLGTMGGKVHAQILVQVLLRLLAGERPQAAVDAPRWVVGGIAAGERDDAVRVEEGVAVAARAALERARLPLDVVPRRSELLGHAQAVLVDPASPSGFAAGSDTRADGAAVAGLRPTPA